MKLFGYTLGLFSFLLIIAWMDNKDPIMPADVATEYNKINGKLDYNRHIKPILSDKCFACHGPDKAKQKAGLRLDQSKSAYGVLPESPGKYAITPGDLNKSEVYHRIISKDPEYVMPVPSFHVELNAKEKAYLIKWIKDGAEYQPHWAFVKPVKAPLPVMQPGFETDHPIDRFVHARLQDINVRPAKEAPKELLLRRLSLDLTGLPPTLEEMDAFVNDASPDAYEKQVDQLLASKHYGERMAADWLDIARFADSHGYTVDRLRDMSPYRDWVIKAYNRNMPFDRFIHEQLAGDLMPNPTKDMLIATAFNRNHQQNMEGGIVEEEFQTEYVMDRTNTFGEAFLAMSVGCARCHDHKYDPVSQKNYYEMYAYFNNVLEAGQISWNDDAPTPTLMLPTDREEKMMDYMRAQVAMQSLKVNQQLQHSTEAANAWIEKQGYASLANEIIPQAGLKAWYAFDGDLVNKVNAAQVGEMKHEAGKTGDKPVFQSGRASQVLSLDGDVYFDSKEVGVFKQSDPFTIGIWAWIPKGFKDGVIFHKSEAERLYNFKGFNLSMKNDRLEILMAHTAPSNAIIKRSMTDVPREQWIHFTMTYDGSSKADGFQLYQNGELQQMDVVIDKLYKDIIFDRKTEPALQIGAWWRGTGFKDGKVDDFIVYDRKLTPFEINVLAGKSSWKSIASKGSASLSSDDKVVLTSYFTHVVDEHVKSSMIELQKIRAAYSDSTKHIKELMVMEEMAKPKRTVILNRGQYSMPSNVQVFPNTPNDIFPFPKNLPANRYGLAQWLTLPDHPLTSRVAVNRIWQQFFGNGLVKTSEDFGNQGEMPSHPELLDWLSVSFRESGWDVKKLIRLIVTSATYKQDSYASKAMREQDPDNRLLARGPASRLTSEMMRDNALMASGLLNTKIGGASVKPYQPAGLWDINGSSYVADSSDEVYRRSLYILVKRTVPNPTMLMFDGSTRSSCLSRRQKTNTPLQALTTLNDPTFVEASLVLGEQMTKQQDASQAIGNTYKRLTGRTITLREMELLKVLQKTEREKFSKEPSKMRGWLQAGYHKADETLDKTMVAANAVVANTIMNSDAVITKR